MNAVPGVISALHTWGQQLSFHPHVHCMVTSSGWRAAEWVQAKKSRYKIRFPVQAMRQVYRAYFLNQLNVLKRKGEIMLTDAQKSEWHSFTKTLA